MKISISFASLILLNVLFIPVAFSQEYQWGIKAGYSLSTMQNIEGEKPFHAFHFGGALQYPLSKTSSVVPSLLFENKGFLYESVSANDSMSRNYHCSAFYLTLPVVFQRQIRLFEVLDFVLQGGIYTSVGISGTKTIKMDRQTSMLKAMPTTTLPPKPYEDIQIFDGFANRWDYGFTGGIGFNLARLQISATYLLGIGLFRRTETGNNLRYSTWQFSMTYFL